MTYYSHLLLMLTSYASICFVGLGANNTCFLNPEDGIGMSMVAGKERYLQLEKDFSMFSKSTRSISILPYVATEDSYKIDLYEGLYGLPYSIYNESIKSCNHSYDMMYVISRPSDKSYEFFILKKNEIHLIYIKRESSGGNRTLYSAREDIMGENDQQEGQFFDKDRMINIFFKQEKFEIPHQVADRFVKLFRTIKKNLIIKEGSNTPLDNERLMMLYHLVNIQGAVPEEFMFYGVDSNLFGVSFGGQICSPSKNDFVRKIHELFYSYFYWWRKNSIGGCSSDTSKDIVEDSESIINFLDKSLNTLIKNKIENKTE